MRKAVINKDDITMKQHYQPVHRKAQVQENYTRIKRMLRDKERHAAENSTFSQVQAPSVSAREGDQDYDSVYPDGGVTFQAPGESTPKSISQLGHNG